MPVRHLLVWLAVGAACWTLLAVAAFVAPLSLLALGALLALPWLRRPALRAGAVLESGVDPLLLRLPAVGATVATVAGESRDDARVLVAQSA
jgi:hypothetical protein